MESRLDGSLTVVATVLTITGRGPVATTTPKSLAICLDAMGRHEEAMELRKRV